MGWNRKARRAAQARHQINHHHFRAAIFWCHYRLLEKSTYPDAPPGTSKYAPNHVDRLAEMLRDEIGMEVNRDGVWSVVKLVEASVALGVRHRALAHWFELAMPTVTMDAKIASSLMCMKVSPAFLADFRLPFDSIQFEIPSGLVFMVDPRHGGLVPVTKFLFARVCDDAGRQTWCVFADDSSGDVTLHQWNEQLETLAGCLPWNQPDKSPDPYETDLDDADRRTQKLMVALAVNACLMMQEKRYVRETRQAYAPSERRKGPPASRHFTLTRPVVHDMRKAVIEYSRNGGKSPAVQCVVAGHWKMQACGAGRAERKRIFIEPYWRGPEDAPIALRPHVLKGEAS